MLPWSRVAVVPQRLGLMEELTVRENVEYPVRLGGGVGSDPTRIGELLRGLGLDAIAERYPDEVSLGEQQRAALARALVLGPRLLLADEPTGHQDRDSASLVLTALRNAAGSGTCCLVATHDASVSRFVDRTLWMRDGRTIEPGSGPP